MKRFQSLKFAGLLMAFFAIAACSQQEGGSDSADGSASTEIKSINPQGASELVTGQNAIIIDVREPAEFEKACLIDSTNIPRGLLEMKIADLCDNPDQLILVHCGAGGRASLAASTLQTMGYSNVHVIDAPFDKIRDVFG